MITKYQKKEILNDLTEKLKKATAIYLANFSRLKTKELNNLREKIKQKGGKVQVVKNNLLKLALKKLNSLKEPIINLKGQTMVHFAFQDPVAVANILNKFIKEQPDLKIIGGFLEKQWIDEATIQRIAKISSREHLIGKLIGIMNAPIFRLVFLLKDNQKKLIYILKEISQKK